MSRNGQRSKLHYKDSHIAKIWCDRGTKLTLNKNKILQKNVTKYVHVSATKLQQQQLLSQAVKCLER